jgi:hypothetical protein
VLSAQTVALIEATNNETDDLKAAFKSMSDMDLSTCLFAAHRVSSRIFQEIYLIGEARGIFNVTTLEVWNQHEWLA